MTKESKSRRVSLPTWWLVAGYPGGPVTHWAYGELTLESPPPMPHSPLSYHHLFFNLSNRPCSFSFNTAKLTGFLWDDSNSGGGGAEDRQH